jgi:hypothetical protein
MESNPVNKPGDSERASRVRELTWALLDDTITEEEMATLNGLLQTEPAARSEYLRCIQLHGDLYSEFAARPASSAQLASTKTPVLGFLHDAAQPLGLPSTAAEDVNP